MNARMYQGQALSQKQTRIADCLCLGFAYILAFLSLIPFAYALVGFFAE